jgi:hypothetical protein
MSISRPIPTTEADKQLLALLESGQVSPEFAREIIEVIFPVHEKATTAIEEASASATPAGLAVPEKETEERISLTEAAELLQDKLDLMAALNEAVKAHTRWGYIDAMIRKGKLESPEQYANLFDAVTLSKKDIQRVGTDFEQGIIHMPIFDAGLLLPVEQWQALFKQTDIPYWSGTYGLNNLNAVRRVTPANFEAARYTVGNLHELSGERQMIAFKDAYKQASPLQPTGARVLFTPDTTEVTRTGITATQDIKSLANDGERTLDIGANLVRFRTQMDAGFREIAKKQQVDLDDLDTERFNQFMAECFRDKSIDRYMPDKVNIIRSSDCVYPNGVVVAFAWYPHGRGVCLDCYPADALGDLGSRRALG